MNANILILAAIYLCKAITQKSSILYVQFSTLCGSCSAHLWIVTYRLLMAEVGK